jgi:NAD(P)-dependent dehydrogenase (short-subunit alcohol dehydrogenase family)
MWRDVILPMASAASGASRDQAWEDMLKRDVPRGRAQTVEDMGRAVVYLCREDNITGIALSVSGGTEMG